MSEILTNNKYYKDIADTIRQMKGVATTYKPREMASALRDMYSTEVEGVPPLTFPSNGNNLLNYRIDGANGGVGDRTKNLANSNEMIQGYWAYADGTYIITNTWICTPKIACKGNVDYTFQFANNSRWYGFVWYDENNNFISTTNQQNNSQTGFRSFTAKSPSNAGYLVINIAGYPGTNDTIRTDDLINFQLEEGSTATDYEPYGYKIPVIINGKNLFDGNLLQGYYSDSNMDDLIATTSNYRTLKIYLPSGTYTFSSSVNILIIRFVTSTVYQQNPNGNKLVKSYTFQINDNGYISLSFRNESNTAWDNSVDLQIEKGLISTSFETYYEPTTTNIYLDEPIEANESKSLSDTNVNIPTINGTNILSIDTTIQPSNVYVQAPKTNGDYNIKVDTSNNISDNWYGLMSYITEIGNIDTSNIIDMGNMFCGCQMITEIPLLNTQNVTNMGNMFYDCSALTTVPLLNTQNVTDMSDMFYGCPALTNESLNNVLKMCINAVEITSNKTLSYIGLSQAQATTCTTLSNYQDFLNAGWTTGY